MAHKHTRKHTRKHGRRHTVKIHRGGVAGSSGFDAQKLKNIKIKMKQNASLKKAQNTAALNSPKPFQVISQTMPSMPNTPMVQLTPMIAQKINQPSSYSNIITPMTLQLPITKSKYNMLNNALVKLNNATAAVHKAMNSIKQ
jgi:hypothetical protein